MNVLLHPDLSLFLKSVKIQIRLLTKSSDQDLHCFPHGLMLTTGMFHDIVLQVS